MSSRDADVEQGHARGSSHRRSWWQTLYQRVSQTGGEDEQEKHLSPHPKRKSVSRTKDSGQTLPLIEEKSLGGAEFVYDDLPPPSALDAYRSGRLNDEYEVPEKAPPHISPYVPSVPSIPSITYQPPEPTKPKTNPPAPLGRSDSLLDRVFTYLGSDAHASNTDLDHGTESIHSRSTSLWRAGSANVIPMHVKERSSVTQANVPHGVYPQPVTPVVCGVVATEDAPSQDDRPPTPPPKNSHIREMADHSMSPPHSPPPRQSSPVVDDSPARGDPPTVPVVPPQPPGIPEPSTAYDLAFPPTPRRPDLHPQRRTHEQLRHVDPRTTRPFPTQGPPSRSPSQRQQTIAGSGPPPDFPRRPPATRNEALLRPFPEPVHHPPANAGTTRSTPPRSKLTMPTPLAQPLPRGSGSLKRNGAEILPLTEQRALPSTRPHRRLPGGSRRHSQPTPPSRRTADPNYVPRPPNPSSRNPHRRISQPLPVLQEASHPNMSPPSTPPPQPARRLSSPPLSALPTDVPRRSNAIRRESLSPPSTSPPRTTSTRLSTLRSAPPRPDSNDFTRYPALGPSSRISSSPRSSHVRPPPSPRTPTFVNAHLLPPQANSPRSDMEEWAPAVSSPSPSMRTKRS